MMTARPARSEKSRPSLTLPLHHIKQLCAVASLTASDAYDGIILFILHDALVLLTVMQ